MRVAVLCSSAYSETGCAAAARLAQSGYIPVGALTLPSWDRRTLVRKVGQWGLRGSFKYAVRKLAPGKRPSGKRIRNPYLENALRSRDGVFLELRELARVYGFPVVTCGDQNSPRALEQLKAWSPDVAIFTGGNILREDVLAIPRLGILNAHLALLPEIRGMSSPEWSLLSGVPLGITIHFMEKGLDTGPILLRQEFGAASECDSLVDLRNRMIAEGIELIVRAVTGLDRGTLKGSPQAEHEADRQFFVMHERLKCIAAGRLKKNHMNALAGRRDE